MKVLYLAHYLENSGWSNVAINNILALDSVGVDVACRNIALTPKSNKKLDILETFERKSAHDATHCIQHILPHWYVYNQTMKNVGILEYETDYIDNINWSQYFGLMDEIWCPNKDLKLALMSNKINSRVFHHCTNISKYLEIYPEISIPEIDYTFKFYTIMDINDRKNLESTIRCFYNAFDDEPVSLFIKVRKSGLSEQELTDYVDAICQKYRRGNKKDYIVAKDSSPEEIMAIHQYCDCFLNTSYGEAWSIPTFDAMAMGNTPISINYGGPKEYITDTKHGTLTSYSRVVCTSRDAAFPDLFSGKDFWYQVDEYEFVEAMKYYYNNRKREKERQIDNAKKFSFETVGNKIKELLDDQC